MPPKKKLKSSTSEFPEPMEVQTDKESENQVEGTKSEAPVSGGKADDNY